MTATSGAWFDRWVDSYDAGRRQLIPCFDAFYGAAAEVAALGRSGTVRVLDLGAGTGILSA
ncbi:MAG: SAM-dependent methyltransferase, partial [Acidimicrobiales bacterium]|nr:SAM-dependent methyltransferase [Acidimicrobiales bacterium]